MVNTYADKGFTEVITINFDNELRDIQKLIYNKTKKLLSEHDSSISLEKKLKVPFKVIPSSNDWSILMKEVNESNELKRIIESNPIKDAFKTIFKEPIPFKVSAFRARVPSQKRVIYNWHQDEGTWYLSNDESYNKKFPATLWLSLNGADENDSIQLLQGSHKIKLYEHTMVEGQGYFNIKKNKDDLIENKKINTIRTHPSQGIIFHPLMVHRSVLPKANYMVPRYSIDIRYYDRQLESGYKVDFLFKLKKIAKLFF